MNNSIRIEFPIGGDIHLRMLAEETLAGELDRWCEQLNLDRSEFTTKQAAAGIVYIDMPNARTAELFSISWHSEIDVLNRWRVRYS